MLDFLMKQNVCHFLLLSIIVVLLTFLFPGDSLAKTDLSITTTDITFSKDEPFAGETIRIFGRVFNLGDTDVYGFVVFLDNGKEITDLQPISVKVNTYDDVFIDWQVKEGNHSIKTKIINTNFKDDNTENNEAILENYFVDLDTDDDKIGNKKDTDDDNDGLTDEQEVILKTDPLRSDTDGDKVRDSADAFPLDPKEWQDTDRDKIGDNADTDDDNDGLTDEEEVFILGSNPLNSDSDKDNLPDKKEKELGTNFLKEDTDGDGVIDSEDAFPLDPTKFAAASLMDSIKKLFGGKWSSLTYIGIGLFLAILFFFRFKRKRRSSRLKIL